jgi:truncated hemoglobin YjbI
LVRAALAALMESEFKAAIQCFQLSLQQVAVMVGAAATLVATVVQVAAVAVEVK